MLPLFSDQTNQMCSDTIVDRSACVMSVVLGKSRRSGLNLRFVTQPFYGSWQPKGQITRSTRLLSFCGEEEIRRQIPDSVWDPGIYGTQHKDCKAPPRIRTNNYANILMLLRIILLVSNQCLPFSSNQTLHVVGHLHV